MIQVPTYEEFVALQKLVFELEREVRYLRQNEVACMTLEQTANALQVSKMTVTRLTKLGKLNAHYEGRKPLYKVSHVRAYIQSKRVSADAADSRVMSALK
ncbi:helix-turn-helix domain-containing protein [Spirosoma koreense]